MRKIILASASPRRKEIFNKLNLDFEIKVSDKEPDTDESMDSLNNAKISARVKAEDVFSRNREALVVGADTVVSLEGKTLGKPKSREDAFNMLKMLSGRKHEVITAVHVCSLDFCDGFYSKTDVEFYDLTDDEINDYIDTKEPMDKAGAYGIQGLGMRFVKGICGDYNNVVGFPAAEFVRFIDKKKNK